MSQPIGSSDVAVTRHTHQIAATQYVEANERVALAKGGAPRENPLAYPKALRQPTLVVNWLYPYPSASSRTPANFCPATTEPRKHARESTPAIARAAHPLNGVTP